MPQKTGTESGPQGPHKAAHTEGRGIHTGNTQTVPTIKDIGWVNILIVWDVSDESRLSLSQQRRVSLNLR